MHTANATATQIQGGRARQPTTTNLTNTPTLRHTDGPTRRRADAPTATERWMEAWTDGGGGGGATTTTTTTTNNDRPPAKLVEVQTKTPRTEVE